VRGRRRRSCRRDDNQSLPKDVEEVPSTGGCSGTGGWRFGVVTDLLKQAGDLGPPGRQRYGRRFGQLRIYLAGREELRRHARRRRDTPAREHLSSEAQMVKSLSSGPATVATPYSRWPRARSTASSSCQLRNRTV